MIEFLRIVILGVAAAVAYGMVHDQITAHLCVEYFSVFHPRVIRSENPAVLALVWGVIATWWMGVILGVPAALIAQHGPPPRLGARDLLRPIRNLLCVMAALALIAGALGYAFTAFGGLRPPFHVRAHLAPERHARFMAAAFAHQTSYASGALGGLFLWLWIFRERTRRRRAASTPPAL